MKNIYNIYNLADQINLIEAEKYERKWIIL